MDALVVADRRAEHVRIGARRTRLTFVEVRADQMTRVQKGPIGVEDMIRLWLDPAGADDARIEFDRGQRDFTERDRAVLDVIRPHLEQLRRRSVRRRAPTALPSLTPREREVLELLAEGRTNREIARALWLSPGTVRKHLENVYEKLDVHTRTAAAAALRGHL